MKTQTAAKLCALQRLVVHIILETADNIDTVSNGFIWFHPKMKPCGSVRQIETYSSFRMYLGAYS